MTFSKHSFRNTIKVSNSLDSDHARLNVGPDLDPNCLQRLSADEKIVLARKESILSWLIHIFTVIDHSKYINVNKSSQYKLTLFTSENASY